MTHPDTLQISRAVVEQAIEDTRKTAREVFKDSCNHTKDAIEFFAAEFGVQIRAAQPAVVHPIGGRPLESDYVKLTSYIEALEQYVDKKEVLWKAYEDVDCDEYDKLRKAALQPQAADDKIKALAAKAPKDVRIYPGGGEVIPQAASDCRTCQHLSEAWGVCEARPKCVGGEQYVYFPEKQLWDKTPRNDGQAAHQEMREALYAEFNRAVGRQHD